MRATTARLALAIALATVGGASTACTRAETPAAVDARQQAASAADLHLVVEREGGLGGLWIRREVRADGRFVATTHRICSVPQCQAAMDSATGTLAPATVAALADAVRRAAPWAVAGNHGRTPNSADMMDHTLRVRLDGRTTEVRGDDGTFPRQAQEIAAAVERAVSP